MNTPQHTIALIPNTTDARITCSFVGYAFRLASTPNPVKVRCPSCGELI
jgi:hypothetical protein